MASIYDLDYQTLGRIFDYVIQLPIHNINDWREYLPLISVCSGWRQMLVDFIYQFAFIIYPYEEEARANGDIPDTNMDLILLCGKHDVASNLFIGFYNNLDFYDCMSYLLKHYLSKGGEWVGIRRLTIYYPYEDPGYMRTPDYNYSNFIIKRYTEIGEKFVEQLCNVKHLDFSDPGEIIPHIFVSILVRAYGRNIHYLECPLFALPRSLRHFSRELSHLKLSLSGTDIDYFPIVLSESLIELKLEGLPPTFSMKYFSHHDRVMDVYFTNLVGLFLRYSNSNSKDGANRGADISQVFRKDRFTYQIHAPKLKTLHLRNIAPTCDVLYSLHNFSLEVFLIDGAFKVFEYLMILPSHLANICSFYIWSLNEDEVGRFYDVTNHFFAQNKKALSYSLHLRFPQSLPIPRDVQWHCLTTLNLNSPVDVACLLQLISRLNNAIQVYVRNLTSISTSVIVSDILSYLGIDTTPICPKLTELWIFRKAVYNSVTHRQMVDTVVHLLKVIPSLNYIDVFHEFAEDIEERSKAESYAYPHLSKVKILKTIGFILE